MCNFGDMRALLHGAQTRIQRERAWRGVLELLVLAYARDMRLVEEQWLGYISQVVKKWPHETRALPRFWLDALIEGRATPLMYRVLPLIRALDATRFSGRQVIDLCQREEFSGVRHVWLGRRGLPPVSLAFFAHAENFSSLESVTIEDVPIVPEAIRELRDATWRHTVRRLTLRSCDLFLYDVARILANRNFPSLSHLHVCGNDPAGFGALAGLELDGVRAVSLSGVGWSEVSQLCVAPWLASLESLELHVTRDVEPRRAVKALREAGLSAPDVAVSPAARWSARGRIAASCPKLPQLRES